MLKYFIAVTEGLIAAAVLLGLLSAFTASAYGTRGRRSLGVGTLAGTLCAAVMAYLKNKTSLIHTGVWNVRIFTLSLIALALFAIGSVLRKRTGGDRIRDWIDRVSSYCGGVLAFTFTFYALPDVLAVPFTISLNGASVFSTFYLVRLLGWILGIALVLATYFAVENTAWRSGGKVLALSLGAALGINALSQGAKILQVLVTRRVLRARVLFRIARWTSNNSRLFLYGVLLAAIFVPVFLMARSFRVRESYDNPAQHRKIRAKWRDARRWSCAAAACFLLAVLSTTWLKAVSERKVELSPIEESELRGENVCVSLSQVEDGHLHRFAYRTPNGKDVRFIVIQKPNSSSFGVGLDACEICGETGYYERDGQVICSLCDVVMNINTIGFHGGCNPIPIDYRVEDGAIIVPVATLVEHESEFK